MKYTIIIKPKIVKGFWIDAHFKFDYLIYDVKITFIQIYNSIRYYKLFTGLKFGIGKSKK